MEKDPVKKDTVPDYVLQNFESKYGYDRISVPITKTLFSMKVRFQRTCVRLYCLIRLLTCVLRTSVIEFTVVGSKQTFWKFFFIWPVIYQQNADFVGNRNI